MLQSRYIVVEDFADNTTKVLYAGSSSIEAQKAMGESVKRQEADCVLFFSHPMHSQIRYPAAEKIAAEERARLAEKQKTAAADAKRLEAAAKREKAKQLSAEAKRLEAEAAAHDKKTESKDE